MIDAEAVRVERCGIGIAGVELRNLSGRILRAVGLREGIEIRLHIRGRRLTRRQAGNRGKT